MGHLQLLQEALAWALLSLALMLLERTAVHRAWSNRLHPRQMDMTVWSLSLASVLPCTWDRTALLQ